MGDLLILDVGGTPVVPARFLGAEAALERRERYGRRLVAGRRRFVLLACGLYAVCALWAAWPAIRHVEGHYLARPAAGYGQAAAGDHLQLAWSFWLVGHQLGRGSSPLADPYSFRPEAEAPPSLQGWLLGLPYWPLSAAFGEVWAYDLVVLLTFVLAGGAMCWWLRSLDVSRAAAIVGGAVFCLMPYRVGQSAGHLIGLIAFLLPALLLALERRRYVVAALVLAAIPLSGQLHLALGAIPLALGYAWARLPRGDWWKAGTGIAAALAAGLLVDRWAVAGSIGTGRSFVQVERYSAELTDFVTRGIGSGSEELVFIGWLTPLLALAGLVAIRQRRGLAAVLAVAAVVPCLLALGGNLPEYETVWRVVPGLDSTRVPERFMPIACLALAALAAFGLDSTLKRSAVKRHKRAPAAVATLAVLVLALDLRVPVFGAVVADEPSAAYAAIRGDGRLLELPVFRPDIHYGSVYLGYARQSPRERPQGYSTLAPPAADRLARRLRGLSCGRGEIPPELGIRFVAVHRGLYEQSGFFGPGCAARAEALLTARGWRLLTRDGPIATYAR
jgi:hypothetical protein